MNENRYSRWIAISLSAILIHVSCSLSVSLTPDAPSPTAPPPVTDTQQIQTEPTDTESTQPTFTDEAIAEATATSPGSSCTILQDLNLRSGPGTAYRPPIRALPVNSVVTPLGFAAQGIPGGSWAYVETPNHEMGWVSAGSQFISCNIELASLPAVAFGTPPPPPLPNSTQTSDPYGNGFCIDSASGYQCVGIFSSESLFQFQILKNGVELGENDGVEEVAFAVRKNGDTVYSTREKNRSYCIFGGNGPCNPWISEDGVFNWNQGGPPVMPGEYEMEVNATVNGESSEWDVNFTITLP